MDNHRKVILSEGAKEDIKKYALRIQKEEPIIATKFKNNAREIAVLLGQTPGIGRSPEYDESGYVHKMPIPKFKRYLILYTITDTEVNILRVAHTSMDLPEVYKHLQGE